VGRDAADEIRSFWDEDATTYDDAVSHMPRSNAVRAAWTAAVARLLPPAPARVLDVGAGTGFLTLVAAGLGHEVTALDVSSEMLGRLKEKADALGLSVSTLVADAQSPPEVMFEVVIERHLLWTLPDPLRALRSWRSCAPAGRLVLFESLWGDADPVESLRSSARHLYARLRGSPPDHHGSYSRTLRDSLPLGSGTPPGRVVELVTEAGWRDTTLERLRDVEWAESIELPPLRRALGVSPRFAVCSR
jgi:ubiquinone/menaquinone biosynthesis C-methylase UbiE